MAETKRQMVQATSIHAKHTLTIAQERELAAIEVAGMDIQAQSFEDIRPTLHALNMSGAENSAVRWFRSFSRNEAEIKRFMAAYRKQLQTRA